MDLKDCVLSGYARHLVSLSLMMRFDCYGVKAKIAMYNQNTDKQSKNGSQALSQFDTI